MKAILAASPPGPGRDGAPAGEVMIRLEPMPQGRLALVIQEFGHGERRYELAPDAAAALTLAAAEATWRPDAGGVTIGQVMASLARTGVTP
jgi:hypothetical protein